MNWFNFSRLIFNIYGPGKVNLPFIKKQGLLAIKIGQAHALRIDFLTEEKCQELTGLYRAAGSLPAQDAKKLLTEYNSVAYLKKFKEINFKPIAAASVGQVHVAKLRSGEQVVIKIIKANFAEAFKKDVSSARFLFRVATFFYPRLRGVANPIAILNNIEDMTLRELDLRNEVAGQITLAKIHRKYADAFDLKKLAFVKIYSELSNENTMVSELLTGPTLDELITKKKLNYSSLLDLFKIQGFYMFCVGTFHGDIHPGNVIYQNGQYYFIDTGYIGHARTKIRQGLFNFFDALSIYDYKKCAYYLNQMAERPIKGEEYKKFEKKFINLYADFTGKTVGEISLTKKMYQTIRLGVVSGMNFGQDIFDIIKSLMYMDGMVLRVNPQAKLVQDMRPFIEEFKKYI